MALTMPGFGDTTFILLLALLLFGPKKLPVLARQLGKLMADFRRASNEFKTQMEEELRIAEQADRQKQIEALEASAPRQAIPEPEHPHLEPITPLAPSPEEIAATNPIPAAESPLPEPTAAEVAAAEPTASTPLPIASSGDLNLMPPSTGLPIGRGVPTIRAATQAGTAEAEVETGSPQIEPAHVPSGAAEHASTEAEAHVHG